MYHIAILENLFEAKETLIFNTNHLLEYKFEIKNYKRIRIHIRRFSTGGVSALYKIIELNIKERLFRTDNLKNNILYANIFKFKDDGNVMCDIAVRIYYDENSKIIYLSSSLNVDWYIYFY